MGELEKALHGDRVPNCEIQVTAAGTPADYEEMGEKLAQSIKNAFGMAASTENEPELMEFKATTDKDKPAKPCMRC